MARHDVKDGVAAFDEAQSVRSTRDEPRLEEPSAYGNRPRVLIDGETFNRVEGDLLLDDDEIEVYETAQEALRAQREASHFVASLGFGESAISDIGSVRAAHLAQSPVV